MKGGPPAISGLLPCVDPRSQKRNLGHPAAGRNGKDGARFANSYACGAWDKDPSQRIKSLIRNMLITSLKQTPVIKEKATQWV